MAQGWTRAGSSYVHEGDISTNQLKLRAGTFVTEFSSPACWAPTFSCHVVTRRPARTPTSCFTTSAKQAWVTCWARKRFLITKMHNVVGLHFLWCQRVCVCRLAVFGRPPLSQRSPIQPALQLHRPVRLSHWPPFSQSHCCWQSAPNWPTSHSAKQEQDKRHEGLSKAVKTCQQ